MIGTSPERYLEIVARSEDCRGAFDPKSEAKLDDTTEDWEIQAEGFGHETSLLKFVVNRVGSQSVREVARKGLIDDFSWTAFVDHLARNLFRLRKLENSRSSWIRMTDKRMSKRPSVNSVN